MEKVATKLEVILETLYSKSLRLRTEMRLDQGSWLFSVHCWLKAQRQGVLANSFASAAPLLADTPLDRMPTNGVRRHVVNVGYGKVRWHEEPCLDLHKTSSYSHFQWP